MVLIQLLLPAAAQDEMARTKAALEVTSRELADTFNGVTAYLRSPAKGLWTAPDGHTELDTVVMVEVVAQQFDRGWWRAYAEKLERRFHQQTIHVRALAIETPDVELGGPG